MKTKNFGRKNEQFKRASDYVHGMGDAMQNTYLCEIAEMLAEASEHICDQGYFGCDIKNCTADHK